MLRIVITVLSFALLSPPAGAEAYKCQLPNGSTEISNRPCAVGSSTLTVRPDEPVSEAARRQAERDVERMRNYVDKREAVQRQKDAAERDARAASQRQNSAEPPSQPVPYPAKPSKYGSADDCLHDVDGMTLEATQRARMESECQNIVKPQPEYQPPVTVPSGPLNLPPNIPQGYAPLPAPAFESPSAPTIVMPKNK